ncbi:MAG: hypothetical protein HUJ42_00460, partial [Malacoplasma sp.]|nr:hypothetical protein [Malacoplasma sp.]
DTDNSYLSHYFLQQFTPYNSSVQNIEMAQAANKVVPNFTKWVGTNPAGASDAIGQIFTTIAPSTSSGTSGSTSTVSAGKTGLYTYYILTAYNSPKDSTKASDPTSNTISNNYLIPYVKTGSYSTNFWATTRVRLSNSAYNSISAASAGTLTIPAAATNKSS